MSEDQSAMTMGEIRAALRKQREESHSVAWSGTAEISDNGENDDAPQVDLFPSEAEPPSASTDDERRERWRAALGYMHGINPEPYIDAGMAVADAERVNDRLTLEYDKRYMARIDAEFDALRTESARLRTRLDYATERRGHHWEEVKRLRAELQLAESNRANRNSTLDVVFKRAVRAEQANARLLAELAEQRYTMGEQWGKENAEVARLRSVLEATGRVMTSLSDRLGDAEAENARLRDETRAEVLREAADVASGYGEHSSPQMAGLIRTLHRLAGEALRKGTPVGEPTPEKDERDPDYCFAHGGACSSRAHGSENEEQNK